VPAVGEPGRFGIYVHVPFCARRCDYCAFATWTDRDHLMGPYVAAVTAELDAQQRDRGHRAASSVFFGGGTPSRLASGHLEAILDAVDRVPGAEVTVECNPEDASVSRLGSWREAGVTRESFGVQSLRSHVLAGLGRFHDPATALAALSLAADAGFDDVNVDLIFGGAGESDDDWRATLDAVVSHAHPPTHVSAYALTVEPGTPLAKEPSRHPDDDTLAHRYEVAEAVLSDAGYGWYEVSNWARAGHQCRHNRLYWAQGDYRGVGCGAHSHLRGRRWWNVRTPERYVLAMGEGRSPVAGEEVLSAEQRAFEALALSLRTVDGVPESAVPDDPALDGLVERRDGRAVLTMRGRLLANEVTTRLVAAPILPA